MSFRVDAEWDTTGWWVVTVPEVPGAITQCKRLDQVAADAAEVIEIQTGEAVDADTLDIHTSLPDAAEEVAADARRLRARAREVDLVGVDRGCGPAQVDLVRPGAGALRRPSLTPDSPGQRTFHNTS